MFDTESQKRDLKYSLWFALIVMIAGARFYWPSAEILGVWISIALSVPSFFIAYFFMRGVRLFGRVTGLRKPVNEKRREIRQRISNLVAEVEEDMEQDRASD
ncbi:MAG: hypothetical protein ACLFMT_02935 [Halobacteriales archaeon]